MTCIMTTYLDDKNKEDNHCGDISNLQAIKPHNKRNANCELNILKFLMMEQAPGRLFEMSSFKESSSKIIF